MATTRRRAKPRVPNYKINLTEDDPVNRRLTQHIDLQTNEIFLFPWEELAATEVYGEGEPGVNWTMSSRLISNLGVCAHFNPGKLVKIHMKTCGGEWQEGMAMHDACLFYPASIVILSYTHSRSMSSLVPQACSKLSLMPSSYMMVHDGSYVNPETTVKASASQFDFYRAVGGPTMIHIYALRMKQRHPKFRTWSLDRIKTYMREGMDKHEDWFIPAYEAVNDFGLADEVFLGDYAALWKTTKEQEERRREYRMKYLEYVSKSQFKKEFVASIMEKYGVDK
jgi:ATP-dependent protease ClpP protease subunit